MNHATIGDKVRIVKTDKVGTITRDRLNGMVDVTLDAPPFKIDALMTRLGCSVMGETISCLYRDEVEVCHESNR